MNRPAVVSQSEWLTARKALLTQEREATHQRDALSAARRKLPMVKLEKEYTFAGPNGPAKLADLFGKNEQLIVYHFMFDPSWEAGCPSCSYLADNVSGALVHLNARNTAFVLVSKAPIAKLEAFKRRMGWSHPWYSSAGNRFNEDFHVTLEGTDEDEYNFSKTSALRAAGQAWLTKGEVPGLSVFLRDGDTIYHTYSTYGRGLDHLLNTYNLLDLTALGRQDSTEGNPMGWVRHHDKYVA